MKTSCYINDKEYIITQLINNELSFFKKHIIFFSKIGAIQHKIRIIENGCIKHTLYSL